ncbi:DUF4232 domain-containing protein [Streptomyces sp. A012304]|uniref:DUF4232 domain-containing protein n=1 Tax=Streptomyces sp. A012304 TaxID=375446 RepID=UPI00222FFA58|nr:DUF4232 domain-containing protein [Streptomyces sp. A012304]GKQ34095.1 hypothetical protein ALMP_06460 [Streptomyces sp. A012304]
MTHPGATAAALACCATLAAALSGCTSDDAGKPSTATTATTATTAAATATATATVTVTEPGTEAPATAASTAPAAATGTRCHTSELRASIGPDHPGAGQENFAVVLTNGSRRTCTVYGYPGLAFVDSAGDAVTPNPERSGAQEARKVALAPGASAWSALTFANPALTGVTTVTPAAVLVTPPDETASIRVAWTGGKVSNTGKASVPRVSPVAPGNGS